MTLSQIAAALAISAACAPAPQPVPLQNTAATHTPRAAASPACPPRAHEPLKLSSGAVGGISGIVIDERCELLAGATVVVRAAAKPLRSEITDEHGHFMALDLAPGQYGVAVYYLDRTLERGGVRIRAGAIEEMQLAMPPPVKAEPRVTQDRLQP